MIVPKQYLLLNQCGTLLYSSNSIFDSCSFLSTEILNIFPLLESIFPYLLALPIGDKETIERVETNTPYLTGIYDFHFFTSLNNKKERYLNWIIEDHTSFYKKLRTLQQCRQKMLITHYV